MRFHGVKATALTQGKASVLKPMDILSLISRAPESAILEHRAKYWLLEKQATIFHFHPRSWIFGFWLHLREKHKDDSVVLQNFEDMSKQSTFEKLINIMI